MSAVWKAVVAAAGALTGALAVAQLVVGRTLLSGTADIRLRVMHEHLGYTLVAATLLYVLLTSWIILRLPSQQ